VAQRYDVVIVGGGAMGSAVAYFLASNDDFDGSILVVERDLSYENCTTARSWGGFRQQFSTPENIQMSMFGVEFVRRAAELLAVEGEAPDLAFREQGYLFLAQASGLSILEANCRRQQALGATVTLLDRSDIAERFAWINSEDLAAAGWGGSNEGWIDSHALLHGLKRKAQALGVTYLQDRVVAIERQGRRIDGVALESGTTVICGNLVNAAGPRAGAVARLAGVDLPVTPRKRMSYVFDCRQDLLHAPLTIDATGVAFRPEGTQYIATVSPPETEDPDCEDLEMEYGLFDEVIWPALAHRIPAFEAIKLTHAWACHYDYNSFDQNAVLGPHPEVRGLMFCNGFSGHGIQQAPAAGRAVAEHLVYGVYRSLDLANFAFDRIMENRPLKEANVV
jgi:glycine/D-amino acid oxidase-like deaminating enzyme